MSVNVYGYKMRGIKAAANETKLLGDNSNGYYIQLSYNLETGEIITDQHYSLGKNSWTQYGDKNIVSLGFISEPKTMQGVADFVADALNELHRRNDCQENDEIFEGE